MNCCYVCKKKVGILGFACQCEKTFCASHRLPEDHSCPTLVVKKPVELVKVVADKVVGRL